MLDSEWDSKKAAGNVRKHSVSFPEAATVFGDPRAITFPDPDHSDDEDREITIGSSEKSRVLYRTLHARIGSGSSVRGAPPGQKGSSMKRGKTTSADRDELRRGYDRTTLIGGVRG